MGDRRNPHTFSYENPKLVKISSPPSPVLNIFHSNGNLTLPNWDLAFSHLDPTSAVKNKDPIHSTTCKTTASFSRVPSLLRHFCSPFVKRPFSNVTQVFTRPELVSYFCTRYQCKENLCTIQSISTSFCSSLDYSSSHATSLKGKLPTITRAVTELGGWNFDVLFTEEIRVEEDHVIWHNLLKFLSWTFII